MADASRGASALANAYRAGRFGATEAEPGTTIRERWPLTIVQLSEIPSVPPPRNAIESALGLALPPANRSSTAGAFTALWSGPGRWQVITDRAFGSDLARTLRQGAAGAFAVTDLSHARTVLRISGPRARDVLEKGCAVDLHPRTFGAGSSIVARLAGHSALVHAVDSVSALDLHVPRSFAMDFWEWLSEAAAEYGYVVAAADL